MKQIGPYTNYGWGWDIKLPFGWWLVWSNCDWRPHIYISSDATPPERPFNRGVTLYRGKLVR